MSEESGTFNLDISEDDFDRLGVLAQKLEESGDADNATLLFKIGVHFGHVWSMTMLADHLSEPPIFKDFKTAEILYKKACLAGSNAACANLANAYWRLGRPVLAQKFWQIVKDRGDPWADEGPPWEHRDDEEDE